MSTDPSMQAVSFKIFGKEYKVVCSEDEQETLMASAHELDEQMKEIRDSGKVNGSDRIAVLAALNLAHELNQAQASNTEDPKSELSKRLVRLRQKIESILK
jgi:cell division protein ZapA